MKKIILPIIASLFLQLNLLAQKIPVYIAPSLQHAIGEFNSTHGWGIGIETGSAKYWFDPKRINKIGFSWKGGYNYYFSKKITTSGFPDLYAGYSLIHAFAGLQFNPLKKTSIRLLAGPGIGIYSGNTRFIIGTEMDATYLFRNKLAAGPLLIMIKESGANVLWAIGAKLLIRI